MAGNISLKLSELNRIERDKLAMSIVIGKIITGRDSEKHAIMCRDKKDNLLLFKEVSA
jgi:hypothetical protein